MAKEDYKGQFKSLAKKLGPGYTVKKLREMSEKDLDKLLSFEEYMDEEIAIRKGLNKGGMSMKMKKKGYAKGGMKKKGYAKGGAMKKKAYAKGGKVAMYNQGGMVKSTGKMNTGVKTAKNTYK